CGQRQKNATLISPTKQQQTAEPPMTKAQIEGKGKEVSPPPASRWINGKASALFTAASNTTSDNAGPSRLANRAQQHATASAKAPPATSSLQQPHLWGRLLLTPCCRMCDKPTYDWTVTNRAWT
ncbi:hypothetical protein BGZ72_002989, partial [Mortierella alpina]